MEIIQSIKSRVDEIRAYRDPIVVVAVDDSSALDQELSSFDVFYCVQRGISIAVCDIDVSA
jgi:hypothetical protein